MDEDEILLEETNPDETTAPDTTPEPEPTPEEPKYKVKYNGEEMEQDLATLITNAQKGMNYDHVHEDLETTRKTSAMTKASLERLTVALNQFGYAGSPQEIADALEAQQREVEPEQVRKEREIAEEQEQAKHAAEKTIADAEAIRKEAVFARDLAEIQRLNPNVKALSELGDTFYKLRAAGLGNVEAYELVNKAKPVVKPPTGKDHLITTDGGTSAGGLMDIPRTEVAEWRDSFPNDTPAKLKERYNRALKRQGE